MRIFPLALILAAASVTACSGTAVGTGGDQGTSGTSGRSGTPGTGTADPGSDSNSPSVPPSGTVGGGATPGPSEYDPLFDAPTSSVTTAGSLSGLWAGSTYDADVRLKLGTNKILIAVRCGAGPAVGLEVSAVITTSSIRVLASKTVGPASSSCGIKVTPQDIPRCAGASPIGCFDVKGTTLSFEGLWLFESGGRGPDKGFTKLSD